MSIKIAVGSSDGKFIDQHFGSGTKFYILELFEDGSYKNIDTIDIKPKDIKKESNKISLQPVSVNDCNTGCSSNAVCGSGSSFGGGCDSGGGCGSGSLDNSELIAKINLLSVYDAVLISNIGNRVGKLLTFSGVQAFENDGLIEKAISKLYIYFKRTKTLK
ncbi:MAG: dinitrogenase iron-molybdenum cofactor biosynthesis protein [Bacillota bacterium]|nr:dinitrogenase iron-molybdenum cofactor biosynthesis protein [Bacillota bacterium]